MTADAVDPIERSDRWLTTRVKAFFAWICSPRDQPHFFTQMKAMLAQPVIIQGQTRQPILRKVA